MWNICFSSIPPCLHHWWAVNSRVRVLIALSCELVSACDRVRLLWRVWLLGVTLHTDSLRGLRTSETNTWPFCRTPRGKTWHLFINYSEKRRWCAAADGLLLLLSRSGWDILYRWVSFFYANLSLVKMSVFWRVFGWLWYSRALVFVPTLFFCLVEK